jgi:xanthine dehydrogenase large subunit
MRLAMPSVEAPAETDELAVVSKPISHDSARLHVQGAAAYVDDIREPSGTLHIALGLSEIAHGQLTALDLTTVRQADGVLAVLTHADIPGKNDVSPAFGDDPMFVESEIAFHGQVIFAVVALTRDQARRAARQARCTYAEREPLVSIEAALAHDSVVLPDYAFGRGDTSDALAKAPHQLAGRLRIGGQEHFYLEGQVALAIPGEAGDILVHSSTQDPTEVQHVLARVLGCPDSYVTVETRRMGGGFGGKESQANQTAAIAALAAHRTGRPCKLRLDRDEDFVITGKRHDMRADWRVGFNRDGEILAYDVVLNARCGYSADLSLGVVDRAMFHADNSYYFPVVSIASKRLRTHTVSNTAFRGFGGPQGMLTAERVIDAVAHAVGRDPLDVRKANLYGPRRDLTPYGMRVEDCQTLVELIEALERSADYRNRRKEIADFNAGSPYLKRGLALTPVKFGISFTLVHLNQAGALVHVYQDGSIALNHGGTEMGQGLFIKVAQIVAEEFGVPLDFVRITPTTTAKVPNASPTAASSGSDLNGMAAQSAARQIKGRMVEFATAKWGVPADQIRFRDAVVLIGNEAMPFAEFARTCRLNRVHLSAAGYYRTPKVDWDRNEKSGRPFFYFAYGAACSEVLIDTLTGEMRLERVDIVHDVGRSLNPAIDIGQIEGGFVQGLGWLTTEELVFDQRGRLRTHAPSTYKIPIASDVPSDFHVALFNGRQPEATIYRSKAVGEPPLMLAISVYAAILDALHTLRPGSQVPLDAPATPEAIAMAAQALRGQR